MTNRKSHTRFPFEPKSTTLDDLEVPLRICFKRRASFGAHHKNLNEDSPIFSATKMQPNDSRFWQYRFMGIFAVVLKICVNFPQVFVCLRPYIIQVWYAVLVFKITSMGYDTGCREYSSTGVTSGDVGSGKADCDPQNIQNPRKNCGSFVDATSSESQQIRPTLIFRITQYLIAFPLNPKHLTMKDPEWPFYVKLCFAPVCLEL